MSLKFGTSGLRGLVTEMTDAECGLYTAAFVRFLKSLNLAGRVALAGDTRSSTPRILEAVGAAIRAEGFEPVFCGAIPTPALTLYGLEQRLAGIMVTGSHIPDDRNGIKFTLPWGEILKADEESIVALYAGLREERRQPPAATSASAPGAAPGRPTPSNLGAVTRAAAEGYLDRYLDFFPPGALRGRKVVCYQHSSVSRELLPELLRRLGAEVRLAGRSERFIPVDTEAVENTEELARWVEEAGADALVSADGDGDRPLVADESGSLVRGDVLGILTASFLGAHSVSAPVSCNTALERCGRFRHVSRTRIGSPYVIESMLEAVRAGYPVVVGYEANGGFLTATDIPSAKPGATLRALPTRDAALPILALLRMSVIQGRPVSALVSSLPARFTHSGLLREFPSEQGARLIQDFEAQGLGLANRLFGSACGEAESLDLTDGARVAFRSGDVVHLRPSGNAPEFRCYTESDSPSRAGAINRAALEIIRGLPGEP